MRIVLDTNVLLSGVFFGGVPGQILEAWRDGRLSLVLTAEILDEYYRAGLELTQDHPAIDPEPFLALLAVHGEIVGTQPLPVQVSNDPDDDKFLACAMSAKVPIIVSGDRDLVRLSGWNDIRVLRPRQFVDEFL